jgi:putative MATE family efflux protein
MTNRLQVSISDKQILSTALPIAAAIFIPQINFLINSIFLGTLGELELGLAGMIGIYYLIFAVVGIGLNNGLLALFSQHAGKNNKEEIGSLFYEGVKIALTIALLGVIGTYFLAPPVLNYALTDTDHSSMMLDFLKIRIWGLPFLYVYNIPNAILVATHNAKFLIIATVVETLANIFFDYALIYGKFGLPALGFNGAAFASIIAEALGLFIVYWVVHLTRIDAEFELFRKRPSSWSKRMLIIKQSAPLIVQHVLSLGSWEFFYILIEHRSVLDLAVSNSMRNIIGIFNCCNWAFASTANSMVSNILGQGRRSEVFGLIWKIIKWSTGFSVCTCLLLNLLPEQFLAIYGQGDEFIRLGVPVLRVVSIGLLLTSFGTVWLNAIVGTGKSKTVLFIESFTVVLYVIYVYVVLEWTQLSLVWAWGSEWLYWITLCSLSFLYMMRFRA